MCVDYTPDSQQTKRLLFFECLKSLINSMHTGQNTIYIDYIKLDVVITTNSHLLVCVVQKYVSSLT